MRKIPKKWKYFYRFIHIAHINNSYYSNGNFILLYNGTNLLIFNNTEELKNNFEKNYCAELEKYGKKELIQIRDKAIKYIKNPKKKEIWLINDRSNRAGDNGESFFRYLKTKNPCNIKYYFVISDKCSDYQRIKNLGDILILGSKKYNETFIKADKLISSVSNQWVENPFGEDRKYLIDLFHYDFIFLQHGISKDDVSFFLNRFKKNYSLIITASKKEYQSFLSQNYDYSEKNIKLTGFSRYDNLNIDKISSGTKKIILIIPTWRMNLKDTVSPVTFESIHSENFINTEFFKFYDNLINSPRLLESMKKYNYTGIFCLHPSFSSQSKDFQNNSIFTIRESFNYKKILTQASLLVTDYSSVFFDFAYLKKPIIYSQFDYEEYRNNHYKKGYFDYHSDGFGSICFELEKCIDLIIDEMKTGCKIKKKFLKRIYKFFAFFDKSNNDRIFKSIINFSLNKKVDNYIQRENIFMLFIIFFFMIKKISLPEKREDSKCFCFISNLIIINYSKLYDQ